MAEKIVAEGIVAEGISGGISGAGALVAGRT